jgi:hypothetical protein
MTICLVAVSVVASSNFRSMAPELWGTFAVDDHCRANAFVRDVLLFDRLVLPFPSTPEERRRWCQPNDEVPGETWDPDRLDQLIALLGSQHAPGHNGARLAFTAPWSKDKWQFESSKSKTARMISEFDTRYSTRIILSMEDKVPDLVEAVAAFPSEKAWREQERTEEQPGGMSAAHALLMFGRSLLTPPGEENGDFAPLRAAIELAQDPDYALARAAYYEWMRDLVVLLTDGGKARLGEVVLNEASVKHARQKVDALLQEELRVIHQHEGRKAWTVAEYTCTSVAALAGAGLALVNPLAGIGVAAAFLGFGGWLSGKQAQPEPPSRSLSGASVFSTARKAGYVVEFPP